MVNAKPMHHHHHAVIQSISFVSLFAFGFVSSLHCVGMCGPLTAILYKGRGSKLWALSEYHLARVLSYSLLGLGLGLAGIQIHRFISNDWTAVLLASVLVLSVLPFRWPRMSLFQPSQKLFGWIHRLQRGRAILMGGFSPLLPCAPLYLALAACLAMGSAKATFLGMAGFALGTIPVHLISQLGMYKLSQSLALRYQNLMFKALSLTAAGMILWMQFG